MPMTFTCFVHRPGAIVPELRFIACDAPWELHQAIEAEMPTWGPYKMIEVYDDGDHPLFRFANDDTPEL